MHVIHRPLSVRSSIHCYTFPLFVLALPVEVVPVEHFTLSTLSSIDYLIEYSYTRKL